MDNLKPRCKINHSNSVDELANILETGDSCNNEGRTKNVREFELRLLHHSVQSLNNKLIEITIMLTVDKLNVNILCFTEHWLVEDQLNVVNIDQFRLVSKHCRNS